MCVPVSHWVITRVSAHPEQNIQQFLTENSMTPMPHPAYSLDITPSDFVVVVVSWDKKVLKGKCFASEEEVKQKQQKC